jgi:hypothetical protein
MSSMLRMNVRSKHAVRLRLDGWLGLGLIGLLLVAGRMLPLVFGTGESALQSLAGFLYGAIRFVLGPMLPVLYMIVAVSGAVGRGHLGGRLGLRLLGAALLTAYAWHWSYLLTALIGTPAPATLW